MAYLTWNGVTLVGYDGSALRAYSAMTLSMTTKTKAKDGNDILYLGKQGYNAASLSITLHLDERFGASVLDEIRMWKDFHRTSTRGRFTLGGQDVMGTDFMLTGVSVSGVRFRPGGTLVTYADIQLTFQESDGAIYENTTKSNNTIGYEESKGSGSSYIKDQTGSGGSGGSGGTDSSGNLSGNLKGAFGGYVASGISQSAKTAKSPVI